MSLPLVASVRCALGRARPARATAVAAVLLTAIGFAVTLFSTISACPVNLAGGMLMVGASRPLLHSVHVHVEHRTPRRRRRLHHQPHWSAMAAVMLAAGSLLTVQTS